MAGPVGLILIFFAAMAGTGLAMSLAVWGRNRRQNGRR